MLSFPALQPPGVIAKVICQAYRILKVVWADKMGESVARKPQTLSIFYDGECPFCTSYVRYYRLNDGEITVSMVNLRNHPEKVAEFDASGLNVDDGMVVILDGETYHGSEAVHVLALLSTRIGVFNKVNRWVFSRRRLARVLYPIMVGGRNLLLALLGRSKIRDACQ